MRLVKVKMLTNTYFYGVKKAGEIYEVDERVANRWQKNKIAEIINEAKETEVIKEEVIEEIADEIIENQDDINYEGLSAKELYEICLEKGLEVPPKKPKEFYIEVLTK